MNVKALNLAILELDDKLKSVPHEQHNWAPLLNNVHEVYHPQDFLGEYSKTSQMAYRGFFTQDFFHSTSLLPWGSRIKIVV